MRGPGVALTLPQKTPMRASHDEHCRCAEMRFHTVAVGDEVFTWLVRTEHSIRHTLLSWLRRPRGVGL